MCSIMRVVYRCPVKRFQMLLDDELDEALRREARRRRTSRADLLRRYARERLRPLPPLSSDPLGGMTGNDDYEPADIDDVVYR